MPGLTSIAVRLLQYIRAEASPNAHLCVMALPLVYTVRTPTDTLVSTEDVVVLHGGGYHLNSRRRVITNPIWRIHFGLVDLVYYIPNP